MVVCDASIFYRAGFQSSAFHRIALPVGKRMPKGRPIAGALFPSHYIQITAFAHSLGSSGRGARESDVATSRVLTELRTHERDSQ